MTTREELLELLKKAYLNHHLKKWTREFDAEVWSFIKEVTTRKADREQQKENPRQKPS